MSFSSSIYTLNSDIIIYVLAYGVLTFQYMFLEYNVEIICLINDDDCQNVGNLINFFVAQFCWLFVCVCVHINILYES